MTPTMHDAAAGAVVRLPDGRTARLVFVPNLDAKRRVSRRKGKHPGNKAKVKLPSGAVLSIDPSLLELEA